MVEWKYNTLGKVGRKILRAGSNPVPTTSRLVLCSHRRGKFLDVKDRNDMGFGSFQIIYKFGVSFLTEGVYRPDLKLLVLDSKNKTQTSEKVGTHRSSLLLSRNSQVEKLVIRSVVYTCCREIVGSSPALTAKSGINYSRSERFETFDWL